MDTPKKVHFLCDSLYEEEGDAYMRLPVESVRDACAIVAGWALFAGATSGCKFGGVVYRQATPDKRVKGLMGVVYIPEEKGEGYAAEVRRDEDGLYVYFFA